MSQPCIFCGQQPIAKNKEHVLPRWLIELTGDPKRPLKMPFQAGLRPGLSEEMSYDSLKFPACKGCNSKFSHLETQAKGIVTRMINSDGLSCDEITVFLDWLDKVRTGLWLGGLYLIGNPLKIRPNFHITSRVGAKDRMVVIHRCGEGPKGLTSYGTSLPLFWYHPICFSLGINHLSFLSVSTDFLIARRLGFPHPQNDFITPEGLLGFELAPGLERSMCPLLKFNYAPDGTEIFQPMFHHRLVRSKDERIQELYETDYVKEHSLLHHQGVGKPLIQEGKTLKFYPRHRTKEWFPRKEYSFEELLRLVPIQTLGLQANLIDATTATNDQRKIFRILRNLNLRQIEKFRKVEITPYPTSGTLSRTR